MYRLSNDNSVERSSVDDMLLIEIENVFIGYFLQSDDLAQSFSVVALSADRHHDYCKDVKPQNITALLYECRSE